MKHPIFQKARMLYNVDDQPWYARLPLIRWILNKYKQFKIERGKDRMIREALRRGYLVSSNPTPQARQQIEKRKRQYIKKQKTNDTGKTQRRTTRKAQ